jgi:arsenate reductase-like glutaredoxin family protein
MHGPNGTDYKNTIVFKEIIPQKYIDLYHMPNPGFDMKAVFVALSENSTAVTTHQIFENVNDCETLKKFLPTANEENFDRQGAFLEKIYK